MNTAQNGRESCRCWDKLSVRVSSSICTFTAVLVIAAASTESSMVSIKHAGLLDAIVDIIRDMIDPDGQKQKQERPYLELPDPKDGW